ncbi:MAG: GntR family transcriptional regulator [Nitrospirota bacterium]
MTTERKIDRLNQEKLYMQLTRILQEKIQSKEWPIGMRIPSEDELCDMFQVSKATVRQAVNNLVTDGFLIKIQGKGTFVETALPKSGYTMKFRLAGEIFGKVSGEERILQEKNITEPQPVIRQLLKLNEGEKVFYLAQVRVVNNEPLVFEESFLPADIIELEDIEEEGYEDISVYNLIQEKSFYRIHKAMQTVEVTKIEEKAAKYLKTAIGSTGLLVNRLLLSYENKPLAFTKLLGNGEKYKFHMEFESIR